MRDLSKILLSFSVALLALLLSFPAVADKTSSKIEKKSKAAMSEYDGMEFEKARDILEEAIELGENDNSKSDALASAYLNLGIVLFSGLDQAEEAEEAFQKAVRVNSEIQLDVAYSTSELSSMLEEARSQVGTGSDCPEDGIEHELLDEAERGTSPELRVSVGTQVDAEKVVLFYRGEGQTKFSKRSMKKESDCEYVGKLPKKALEGDFVHYYIAAIDEEGEELESKGSGGSPNIIEVMDDDGQGGFFGDDDNPLDAGDDTDDEPDSDDSGSPSIFISLGAGTGSGWVNGPTEKTKSPLKDCPGNVCLAASWLHLIPEIGYYLNRQSSISLAFRAGLPLGANVKGHATFAPAGLLRYRHHFDVSGSGLQVNAAAGFGVIRNTIGIENAATGMDTDTTVTGPILLGAGFGYSKPFGSTMKLVAEINMIAGLVAGMTDFGSCPGDGCAHPKNGAELDATLSVLFAF